MSSAAPCQEPPPAFAGGSFCARPSARSTAAAAAAAKVAPETWLDSVWAAAASLLDDEPPEGAAGAGDPFYSLDFTPLDDAGSTDQLSTQLYRNKQLQDTLLQKEEELARLQEENHHLRQFLNSTLVKRLEEKTKKLLRQTSQKSPGAFQSSKRRLKAEPPPLPPEASQPQKARRNLLGAFSACEGEARDPRVDTWVLQTLGLKDVDTIDESSSANYNALPVHLAPSSFLQGPDGSADFGQPAAYSCEALPPVGSTASARNIPLPSILHPPAPYCHSSPLEGDIRPAPCCCNEDDIAPAKMDVAFTTSLSPHCNVKTHTFRQGQAFVRRDADGGWKLTWVPKQPE